MNDFKFNWAPEFEIGIPALDQHHKEMFRIGREIEGILNKKCIGVTEHELLNIVIELRNYANYHEYKEEELMKENQYPKIEEHKQDHLRFYQHIGMISPPLLKSEPQKELNKIKDFLIQEIYEHMLTKDKEMAAFIIQKNKDIATNGEFEPTEYEIHEMYGINFKKMDLSTAYLHQDDQYGKSILLIAGNRRRTLDQLTVLERNIFFAEVDIMTRAIKKALKPDFINYFILSDKLEDFHVYIIPVFKEGTEKGWNKIQQEKKGEVRTSINESVQDETSINESVIQRILEAM